MLLRREPTKSRGELSAEREDAASRLIPLKWSPPGGRLWEEAADEGGIGDAADSQSTGNSLAETNSYQTAALLDDAPATIENEKSEPARRASEPRHYEARRHYAWSRQRRERRFAGGPPPAMPTGFFYAPWY